MIGIDPDGVKTIFQPHCLAKLSRYLNHGSTGLGLSILSSLMKLMGGSTEVKSYIGRGLKFTLHLLIRVANDQTTSIKDSIDMSDPFLS